MLRTAKATFPAYIPRSDAQVKQQWYQIKEKTRNKLGKGGVGKGE